MRDSVLCPDLWGGEGGEGRVVQGLSGLDVSMPGSCHSPCVDVVYICLR